MQHDKVYSAVDISAIDNSVLHPMNNCEKNVTDKDNNSHVVSICV